MVCALGGEYERSQPRHDDKRLPLPSCFDGSASARLGGSGSGSGCRRRFARRRCRSGGRTPLPQRTMCLRRLGWARARAKPALRTKRRRRRGEVHVDVVSMDADEPPPPPRVSLAPPPSPRLPRFCSPLVPQLSGAPSPRMDFARLSLMSPYPSAADPRSAWFSVGAWMWMWRLRTEGERRERGRGCGWCSFSCGRSRWRFSICRGGHAATRRCGAVPACALHRARCRRITPGCGPRIFRMWMWMWRSTSSKRIRCCCL
ncbi:hypothetical protein B0H14DRAFT_160100 [Mycena olivaceomarginata]|nr:hypothetical protein B0H14DRAFT_160100 [Mycena olivaceomarginata]